MDPSPMFLAFLISPEAASSLPDFTIRPLDKGDYARGFLECLRDLALMGNSAALTRPSIEDRTVIGHVEEVCVVKDYQGRGLGRAVLGAFDSVARNAGCTEVDPHLRPGERGILCQVRVQEHLGHRDVASDCPAGLDI